VTIERLRSLAADSIRFVRIVWCDNANVIRAKAVHVAALADYLEHGVGITPAQQAVPVMFDAPVADSGLGPVGEIRLVPDWTTVMKLPFAPGHARVFGDMMQNGRPWSCCPRDFLKRQLAVAARDGLELVAAFENEFYLLNSTSVGLAPADDTVFGAIQSMNEQQSLIDDLADALIAQGLPVEMYNPESGPGQQEMTIRATDALAAADRQLVFRETVHAMARRHGVRASFLPKIFASTAGNGCHLHLSVWHAGKNLFPDPAGPAGLSSLALAFLAGLSHHLPALMAMTTPSTNSYRRLKPRCWSGAFRCWGADNREAAIRVPTTPDGQGSQHIELKTVDGSANPYLALGAVVAAGLDGLRRGLDPGVSVAVDPADLSEAECRQAGIERLPVDLREALGHLLRNDLLQAALGPELSRAYVAVRRAEWDALNDLSLDEEVKLLWQRY
jgi:glutamine synthetase